MDEGKGCSRCGEWKSFAEFSRQAASKDGHGSWCRPCVREYQRDWKREKVAAEVVEPVADAPASEGETPAEQASRHRRELKRQGMTVAEYGAALEEQGGGCAVCESTDPGEVSDLFAVHRVPEGGRALLCHGCHSALRNLADSRLRVIAAASYLESGRRFPSPGELRPRGRSECTTLDDYLREMDYWRRARVTRVFVDEVLRPAHGGACAICSTTGAPVERVDRVRASGEVRGLLCAPCGEAVGFVGDDAGRLRAMAVFLRAV